MFLGGHQVCTPCTTLDTFCPEGAIKPEQCSIDKFCDGKSRQDRPGKPFDVEIELIENRNAMKVYFVIIFIHLFLYCLHTFMYISNFYLNEVSIC